MYWYTRGTDIVIPMRDDPKRPMQEIVENADALSRRFEEYEPDDADLRPITWVGAEQFDRLMSEADDETPIPNENLRRLAGEQRRFLKDDDAQG